MSVAPQTIAEMESFLDMDPRASLSDIDLEQTYASIARRLFDIEVSGPCIGRFEVVRRLGVGGNGAVYVARDPKLGREVAIKRLLSLHGQLGERRREVLIEEAKHLAKFSHPNVVAVHEIHEDDDDAYVVMEYVEGENARDWLTAGARSAVEILGVYRQAGRGLAAAHAQDMVHRDVKPDNILVGSDGRVRMSDFGTAVRVGDTAGPAQIAGTPHYMAPEQLRGSSPDARSDQYSFCASLLEALTGSASRPDWSRVPRRVRAALRRGTAHDPEERFADMTALLAALDDRRGRRPVVLGAAVFAAAIAGGLIWSRSDRSRSVCAGADSELEATWNVGKRASIERALREVDRPFVPGAVAGAVRSLDAYGERWKTVHTRSCRATRVHGHQSNEILTAKMRCLGEARRSLARLIADLQTGDVETARGAIRAIQNLPPPARCDGLSTDEPVSGRIPEDILEAIIAAESSLRLGHLETSRERVARAVALAERSGSSAGKARALLVRGRLTLKEGQPLTAMVDLEAALWAAIAAKSWHVAVSASITLAEGAGAQLSKWNAATAWIRRGEGMLESHDDAELRALMLAARSEVAFRQGSFRRARTHREKALAQLIALKGEQHLEVTRHRAALGLILVELEQYDLAIATLRAADAADRDILGETHPDRATTLINLAMVLDRVGKGKEAMVTHDQAVSILEAGLSGTHPMIALALNNRALSHLHAGRYDAAARDLDRAWEIAKVAYEGPHRTKALVLDNLGRIDVKHGKFDRAITRHRAALAMRERVLGPEHVETADSHNNLAIALANAGKLQEAYSAYERARTIFEALYGKRSHRVANVIANLSGVRSRQDRTPEALALSREALGVYRETVGVKHPSAIATQINIGMAEFELGRSAAKATLRAADESVRAAMGPKHPYRAYVLTKLGRIELRAKQPGQAKTLLDEALTIATGAKMPPGLLAEARFALAKALWAQNKRSRARRQARRAQQEFRRAGPLGGPRLAECTAWLAKH